MVKNEEKLKSLVIKLFEIDAFKFGNFKMKSGINSPVYFDLRVIVSHPDILANVADLLLDHAKEHKLKYQQLCGVPYTALPIATIISVKDSTPMLIRRKEAKAYGTKKLIEGKFAAGEICLIIEDVVTSGSSILETVKDLRSEGIVVNDAIVVVNREQGGLTNIENQDVKMHSLFTLSFLLKTLQEAGKIEESTVKAVGEYISSSQIINDEPIDRTKMTFENRIDLAKSENSKRLFKIMYEKKSNLCIAADLTNSEEILNLAETVGPYICMLKTHVDIITDFNENFVNSLTALSKRHNFMIMEDRKFADIGNTVALQYEKGPFNISNWADLVTVHTLPGQGILQGIKSVLPNYENRGVVLLAEMSSQGNLFSQQYIDETMKLATGVDIDFVTGIVCQNSNVVKSPGLIQMTPGVQIDETNDNLGQQYNSPELVIKEKGADIGIVGRGIIKAKNIETAAKLYRNRLWSAYCERVKIADE